MKNFSLKDNITELLAIVTIAMSFIFLMLVIYKPIPQENKDLVNLSVGFIIGTAVSGVIGYYFGTSKNRNIPTEPGQTIKTVQESTITEGK